jgi:hypothetical protein
MAVHATILLKESFGNCCGEVDGMNCLRGDSVAGIFVRNVTPLFDPFNKEKADIYTQFKSIILMFESQ